MQADWVQNLIIWSQSILFQSTAGLVLSSTLPIDTVQAFIRSTGKLVCCCFWAPKSLRRTFNERLLWNSFHGESVRG